MHRNRNVLTLCLLLVILTTQGTWAQQTQVLGFNITNGAKSAKFPFEIYNNLIVVPVILNNQLPLKFVLDTGVRTTILTEKTYSDILNLQYNRKYTIAGLGKEKLIEAYVTNNVSLTLPGVRGKGHAMLVLAEDYLEMPSYLGTHVHGIMGYELFSRFIVSINYDSKVLTISDPKYFKPKKTYESLNITIEDTKPYLKGKINYHNGKSLEVKLMIDSGASHGLLLDETSDARLVIPDNHVSSSLGRGLGGVLHGKVSRLKGFELTNNKKWEDIITTFPDEGSFLDSLKSGVTYRNGSMGGEILSRFKVIFDFPNGTLYLKRGKEFKTPFSYDLSGLVLKATGAALKTYEIVEVRDNSVGKKAGLMVGDVLISVNNQLTENLQLANVIALLNSKENKRLKVKYQRGKEIKTSIFRLKSLI